MTNTSALVTAAIRPVLSGTAFDNVSGDGSGGGSGRRGANLLWCTPAPRFRRQHAGVPEALDPEHPDGCIDLCIDVDDEGRLVQAKLEMMGFADDLAGESIETALPVLVDRLGQILGDR